MSADTNPMVGMVGTLPALPGDTIDHVRDALALVAAALAAPYDARPERAEIGAIKLLTAADEALEVLARMVAPDGSA